MLEFICCSVRGKSSGPCRCGKRVRLVAKSQDVREGKGRMSVSYETNNNENE